ncbi:NAD(P)-dependent oxidoreductase [Mycobacterium montefiorense]|uniref:NAD(P)-dependent oxidoreductase n=1 Tax=Mycobacterium montefiorense TaxID=154654 RepID=UPI0021DCDAF3|nr:NAD(P)-dependent oxidoreductase [Mycobacterium montefiorense]MCV7429336.1 NAD(P)-dependent oxidoreductase [Mycobacterium montefiorense]GLE51408.1 oxidoreductase [Mycobacterium montefiorense]
MTIAESQRLSTTVIGLGPLGIPIALHILGSQHQLVGGVDIDPCRTAMADAVGIPIAGTVAEAANAARLAITVLPSVESLNAVCAQLTHCRDGQTRYLVDLSTLPADAKAQAAATLRTVGITLLDCPVIGTSAQAYGRDVVVCASGPKPAVEAVKCVLDTFSKRVEYVGELGAGANMKVVANHLVTVHNAATAEAINLAQRLGIDPEMAVDILSGTGAGSRQLELRGPMMASGTYKPMTATVATFVKDADLISELACSANSPAPLLNTAADLYRTAKATGFGGLDSSAIHAVYAGLSRRDARPMYISDPQPRREGIAHAQQ